MTHVLIAVDDSDTSVRAATTAHRLFGDEARYTVLNVAPGASLFWGGEPIAYGTPYPLYPGVGAVGGVPLGVQSPAGPENVTRDRIEVAEQRADDVAQEAGIIDARPVGDTGDAAEAILATARDHGADVIVVGSHDRNWFSRLFTGSVAEAVTRDADIPVLVAH
jgi:nucleotide-binding universal stress UspA family protein